MAEAKTAIKKGSISAGRDVLPRYLQGGQYSTRAMRRGSAGGGSGKKLGKRKLSQLKPSTPIDKHGFTIGGWNETLPV